MKQLLSKRITSPEARSFQESDGLVWVFYPKGIRVFPSTTSSTSTVVCSLREKGIRVVTARLDGDFESEVQQHLDSIKDGGLVSVHEVIL